MADLIGQVTLLSSAEGGMAPYRRIRGFTPMRRAAPQNSCPFALRFMCDDSLRPGESDAAMIDVDTPMYAAILLQGRCSICWKINA